MEKRKTFLCAARKKLGGRGGETLAETLVALLISALAIVMLAGMITTSADMIHVSNRAFDEYYAANNGLTEHAADAEGRVKAEDGAATLTFGSSPDVTVIRLKPDSDSAPIKLYVNKKAPDGTPVVSYEKSS